MFQHILDLCSRLVVGHIEDITKAWNDVEEAEEKDEDGFIKLWLPNPETEIKTEADAKQAIPSPILQDPSNFSWCLGGVRFSSEGFYLGLCECSGSTDSALFKRYVGCTGPWEQYGLIQEPTASISV